MSRKILRLLAVGLALGLVAAACSDDSDSSSDSGDSGGDGGGDLALVSADTLTVCTDSPYIPFEFEDEDSGEFDGFDVAVVNGMAESLGLSTTYKVTVFDTILASLEAGDCDIVASAMTITDERAEQVNFTDPYFDADQSLLVRSEDEGTYATLEDLAGQTIGVQSGTTGESYAEENLPEGAELKSFDSGDEMFAPLQSGDIAAVLQDLPVNGYRATQDDAFLVTETFPTGEEYGIAVSKSNEALLDALNEQLTALRDDGTYDEIFETWFG